MTKLAMNASKRQMKATSINTLKHDAITSGYRIKCMVECPVCKEEMEYAIQSVGYIDTTPVWGKVVCAFKFYKKNKPLIIACPCGYRHKGKISSKSIIKTRCPGKICEGKAILGKREINENGGFCYRCKPLKETPIPANINTKICNRKGCNNIVPVGRKAVCYSCQPAAKEPVAEFICSEDELIYLQVGGLKYVYSLEKVFHKEFFKLMKYRPGRALNYIKDKSIWNEGV